MRSLLVGAFLLLTGCSSYRHEYTTADGGKDVTRFGSFLMLGSANKIHSSTKWTNYSRTVSVGSVEGKGDAEMIQAIAAGIAEGLKKSQGVP
jgi:hypothetical protein